MGDSLYRIIFQPLCKFLLRNFSVLTFLFFFLRFLAPSRERLLRNFACANPREAALVLAAIDFQQLVLCVALHILPHRADLLAGAAAAVEHAAAIFRAAVNRERKVPAAVFAGAHRNPLADTFPQRKVNQVVQTLRIFGFFYGLRRSEIVGLKWQNFDLVNNTFTVAHTVTTYSRKGEPTVVYAKDKTKNASSLRTLPLIPLFQKKMKELRQQQKEAQRLFGNCYSRKYLGYIYVNEIGELIKPDYISEAFSNLLEKNGLRHIRFHDTRHSCASLQHCGDRRAVQT